MARRETLEELEARKKELDSQYESLLQDKRDIENEIYYLEAKIEDLAIEISGMEAELEDVDTGTCCHCSACIEHGFRFCPECGVRL